MTAAKFTHRERVLAALNHEETDRCPMQISYTPEFAKKLRGDLQLAEEEHNPHGGGNSYSIERALGQDLLTTSVGWANSYYGKGDAYTDEWGVGWKSIPYQTPFGVGHYTEMIGHPLANTDALAHYQPPDPRRPELYQEAVRLLRNFQDEYYIVGATVATAFETATALRGLENILTDFLVEPDFAQALLEIPHRYHLTAARQLVELGVDMIWIGDDVGAQRGMMISPELWRRFLKPLMAEFIVTVKQLNPQLKIAYHSDGDIYPIIPELIEVGVHVLNPIQPGCMDPARLKNEFGDCLCFMGAIDVQKTLPFGTPEDVSREVLTRLSTIGKGGGLIIGPTHHVQLDTPLENFWAMVNAIKTA